MTNDRSGSIKVLILAANPYKGFNLRLDKEVKEIDEVLRNSLHRERFKVVQRWAVTPKDMQRAIIEEKPQIVHFCGHGAGVQGIVLEGEIVLEDEIEIHRPKFVTSEALAELFKLFEQVECVLLNACYTEIQAQAISQHIPYVIGMNQPIGDRAAIEFAGGFYHAIGSGKSYDRAYNLGCSGIRLEGIPEADTPILLKNSSNLDRLNSFNKSQSRSIPKEFQELVNKWTKDFVGREYVFEGIAHFIASQSKGYYLIEGDPGIGKSTILAEYAKHNNCIAYFNRQPSNTRSEQFLEHLCGEIIVRYGLSESQAQHNSVKDGGLLSRLLDQVKALTLNEKLIIVVDALDEVSDSTSEPNSPINILYLPRSLPNNVYFILTRRRFPHTLSVDSDVAIKVLDLMKYKEQNLEDTRKYIHQEVVSTDERGQAKRQGLQKWINNLCLTNESFITQINGKSEGNFLYVFFVLNGIEAGFYSSLNIQHIPEKLNGYYNDLCRRVGMFSDSGSARYTKARIAYILSETYNPIPYEEIVSIIEYTGEKDAALLVDEVFEVWIQVLRVEFLYEQFSYSPYHRSYRDFLHDHKTVKRAGVSIKEIRKLMLDAMDLYGDG